MKKFDRIEQIQPAAPEPSREPVDVEALAQGHIDFGRKLGDDYGRGMAQAGADVLAALRRVQPEKESR